MLKKQDAIVIPGCYKNIPVFSRMQPFQIPYLPVYIGEDVALAEPGIILIK